MDHTNSEYMYQYYKDCVIVLKKRSDSLRDDDYGNSVEDYEVVELYNKNDQSKTYNRVVKSLTMEFKMTDYELKKQKEAEIMENKKIDDAHANMGHRAPKPKKVKYTNTTIRKRDDGLEGSTQRVYKVGMTVRMSSDLIVYYPYTCRGCGDETHYSQRGICETRARYQQEQSPYDKKVITTTRIGSTDEYRNYRNSLKPDVTVYYKKRYYDGTYDGQGSVTIYKLGKPIVVRPKEFERYFADMDADEWTPEYEGVCGTMFCRECFAKRGIE
jgi:hypothetical protein